MSWVVSRQKDFIGKRSYSRADASCTDRKQLVGLLPSDRTTRLPEGTQLVTTDAALETVPVPMLGHVTSSYHSQPSAPLRPRPRRRRAGEEGPDPARPGGMDLVPVEVTDFVLHDP
ncbi:hypothetical protein GCM10027072_46810 [Streptomyces bullii]